ESRVVRWAHAHPPFAPAQAGGPVFQACVFGPRVPAFEAMNLSNLGDLARAPHARPHGEEARAARRLEPWQQVRTRGHPSRRPRFARAPQDEVGVVKDSQALPRDERRLLLPVRLALRVDDLLELAEHMHAGQDLLKAGVRLALTLDGGDELAVLQLDAVHG